MAGTPNNFGAAGPPDPMAAMLGGREKIETRRLPLGGGRFIEAIFRQTTEMNDQGIWVTETLISVDPPLECGDVPTDIEDVVVCQRCGALVCASKHAVFCQAGCGRLVCTRCVDFDASGEGGAFTCKDCADTPKGIFGWVSRFVWGDI
jgi:hypothetical protein